MVLALCMTSKPMSPYTVHLVDNVMYKVKGGEMKVDS